MVDVTPLNPALFCASAVRSGVPSRGLCGPLRPKAAAVRPPQTAPAEQFGLLLLNSSEGHAERHTQAGHLERLGARRSGKRAIHWRDLMDVGKPPSELSMRRCTAV